jgi:hypothetical protein
MLRISVNKIIILLAIIWLVYESFFYVDPIAGCFVSFRPSVIFEFNTGNIKNSITLLKNAVPDEYQKFCKYVKKVDANLGCGGFGGGCYYANNTTLNEITVSAGHDERIEVVAGVVAHETCHAIQFYEKRSMSESECYEIFDKVLNKVVKF